MQVSDRKGFKLNKFWGGFALAMIVAGGASIVATRAYGEAQQSDRSSDVSVQLDKEEPELDSVSLHEYRSAMLAALDCINAEKTIVDPASVDLTSIPVSYRYVAPITEDDVERIEWCYDAHAASVDRAYQARPDVQVALRAAFEPVAQCLEDAGIDFRALARSAVDNRAASGLPRLEMERLTIDELIGLAASALPADNDELWSEYTECRQLESALLPD